MNLLTIDNHVEAFATTNRPSKKYSHILARTSSWRAWEGDDILHLARDSTSGSIEGTKNNLEASTLAKLTFVQEPEIVAVGGQTMEETRTPSINASKNEGETFVDDGGEDDVVEMDLHEFDEPEDIGGDMDVASQMEEATRMAEAIRNEQVQSLFVISIFLHSSF